MDKFKESSAESFKFKVSDEDLAGDKLPVVDENSANDSDSIDHSSMPQYAGLRRRLLAALADSLVTSGLQQTIAFLLVGITFPFYGLFLASYDEVLVLSLITFVASLIAICMAALINATFESSKLSATPGKLMLNLKVTNLNFTHLSFWQAFKKQIIYGFYYLLFFVNYFIFSFVFAGFDFVKFLDSGFGCLPAILIAVGLYFSGLIIPFLGRRKQTFIDLLSKRVVVLKNSLSGGRLVKDDTPFLNLKFLFLNCLLALSGWLTISMISPFVSRTLTSAMIFNDKIEHSHPNAGALDNPRYSYINKKGERITSLTYEDVDDFREGLGRIKENRKYGFLNKEGKVAIPVSFHRACNFKEGLAAVQAEWGGKWGFIDPKGDYVIKPRFDSVGSFSDGLARVSVNEKYGYINKFGEVVIPFKFIAAQNFCNGIAHVTVEVDDQLKCKFIDKNGKFISSESFEDAYQFSQGLAAVKPSEAELWGFINQKGEMVIQPKFIYVESFHDGFAVVYTDRIEGMMTNAGVIDKTGKFVMKPKYAGAIGLAKISLPVPVANSEGKWGFIDEHGSYVIPPQFDDAEPFFDGIARVGFLKK